jgi:hypothetical protein
MHLLVDPMVEIKVVESISNETVRRTLKKRTQVADIRPALPRQQGRVKWVDYEYEHRGVCNAY